MFLELFDFELFFFKINNFSEFKFFFEKNVSCKFYAFPEKTFGKSLFFQTSEIQKYDHRKFYFFSEKKHFQIWYSRSSLKKKFTIFFPYTEICKTKKFAISKISNKKFRKIHYVANIKYERNSRKYCGKNLRRNIFVKRKIFAKKNSIKKFSPKKIR